MKNQELRPSTVQHVSEYIDERIAGANKQESAQRAGYAPSTSRNPSLIENTTAYAVIVTETLNNNSQALRAMVRSINEDMANGAFDELPMQTKVEIAYKVARIHDVLTPKVTVKTSTDAKGNKTTTAWGTGGAPLHDGAVNE